MPIQIVTCAHLPNNIGTLMSDNAILGLETLPLPLQ